MGKESDGCHPDFWPGGSFVKSQSERSYYLNCLPHRLSHVRRQW